MTEVELSFPHGKGPGSVIKPADLTVVTAAAQNVRVLLIELDTGEVAGGAEHAPAQTGAQCAICNILHCLYLGMTVFWKSWM